MMKDYGAWIVGIITITIIIYFLGAFNYAALDISLWESRKSAVATLSISYIIWTVVYIFSIVEDR